MPDDEGLVDQSEIESLLRATEAQAPRAPAKKPLPKEPAPPAAPRADQMIPEVNVASYQLDEIAPVEAADADSNDLSLILDVDLSVRVELGRAKMYIEDVLRLREGAVVPLDKLAGDPVDIYVNGRLMGRGEVLVLNDNFCVRVSEVFGDNQASPPGD